MMTEESLNKLRTFAETAHSGQFRRDGKTPYITHIYAVEQRVSHLNNDYRAVAIAHDLLEDTNVTVKDLLDAGIPENIVEAVKDLTKEKDMKYSGYYFDEYLYTIKRNELARRVKIADMLSNLSDDPTDKQILKYAKGLSYLLE